MISAIDTNSSAYQSGVDAGRLLLGLLILGVIGAAIRMNRRWAPRSDKQLQQSQQSQQRQQDATQAPGSAPEGD